MDVNTGEATSVAAAAAGATTNTFVLGMDFNPRIDAVRVVTESGQNIVYTPSTGAVTGQTSLFYGPGDVNATTPTGPGPNVVENAYNNNIVGVPAINTTTQYVLDHRLMCWRH